MTTYKHNSAEGGTDTTVVTVANSDDGSSGDACSAVTGTQITYTTSSPLAGSVSFAYASSGTTANFLTWGPGSLSGAFTVRFLFRASSWSTSASQRVLRGLDSTQTTGRWSLDITTGGAIRIRTGSGYTQLHQSTLTLSTDTTYILQLDANHTADTIGYTVRDSTGSPITDFTWSSSAATMGGATDYINIGAVLSTAGGLNHKFDDFYIEDVYAGPGGAPPGSGYTPFTVHGQTNP